MTITFTNVDDWTSDATLEREGVAMDLGKGRVIFVRRAGGANRAFTVALAEVLRRVRGDREPEAVTDNELDPDLMRLYGEHVVVGWRGFLGEGGREVPFTAESFVELMKVAPDLWIRVRTHAHTRESFQAQVKALERDKVTVGKSSRGKRNGGHSARV